MVAQLDPRIVKVSISINGKNKVYQSPFAITAIGTKFANPLQNEATITIYNIDKDTQDDILTQTSPFNLNRTPKFITLEAGRESYGTAVIFSGNIIVSNVSQPPDIGLTMKCLTGNFIKGNIINRSYGGIASLSQISHGIAQDTNTILNFQATDKNVSNYAFTGAALKQIALLNSLGNINAFVDNTVLNVVNAFTPLQNKIKLLSAETGLIGIPEFTEQGIRVKFLLDNHTTLGGLIRLTSKTYPAINGDYFIYKLSFQIASRDTPFYYIAEAKRIL